MTKLFCGGIPTSPDVRKIREAYPDNETEFVSYADLEELLGTKRNTSRFRAVVTRWRKLVERESGKVIGAVHAQGFKVLSDSEKLDLSGGKLRSAVRLSRRSYMVTGLIDRRNLTEDELGRLDMVGKRSAAVIAAAQLKSGNQLPVM